LLHAILHVSNSGWTVRLLAKIKSVCHLMVEYFFDLALVEALRNADEDFPLSTN
jgi:hypothetical protein